MQQVLIGRRRVLVRESLGLLVWAGAYWTADYPSPLSVPQALLEDWHHRGPQKGVLVVLRPFGIVVGGERGGVGVLRQKRLGVVAVLQLMQFVVLVPQAVVMVL